MPNPVIPSPPVWASGPIPAPELRAVVSDAIALLSKPPAFAGQQTTTNQTLTANTTAGITLDTEIYDNYDGHITSINAANYYPALPGWYLCEGSVPIVPSTSSSYAAALIGGIQNNGTLTYYAGMSVPNSSTSVIIPAAAKLMLAEHGLGTLHGDYVQLAAENGAAVTVENSPNAPYFSARWICALSGTSGLAVPSNPAWPVPPSYVTSAFLNTNVSQAIEFLIYPPIMEAYRNSSSGSLASQSSIPSAGTTIVCDTKVVDNYTAFSTSTGTWTAPAAGRYWCYGCLNVVTNTNSNVIGAGLTVTSANYNGGTTYTIWGGTVTALSAASSQSGAIVRKRLRLNAGDTIALAGFQNSASSGAIGYFGGASTVPRLIIVWEGS
jgi:hypothetical protein